MSDSRRVEINDRTFVEFLDDGGCCVEQDLDRPGVTVYLEPEDRSALLWALLEEEAGEVVEVRSCGSIDELYTTFEFVGGRPSEKEFGPIAHLGAVSGGVYVLPGGRGTRLERGHILCLARAIQEQKRREVSGE